MVVFIDVLESFCWNPIVISSGSSKKLLCHQTQQRRQQQLLLFSSSAESTTESTSNTYDDDDDDDDENNNSNNDIITLTLPSFVNEDDDESNNSYPSLLHHIYVHKQLLSTEEAQSCCEIARDYAKSTGRWLQPDSERHESYSTCDFPVEDCDPLNDYLEEIDFDGRLFESLASKYDLELEDLSYLDLFVANYQANPDDSDELSKVMDRLELHRDGSILAFSLLLNPPEEFEGGGTFYDALRDVKEDPSGILYPGGVIRPKNAGDAVLHCGKILHGADTVTSGNRTVLVGFVDVSERCVRPRMIPEACTKWGRMDVVNYHFRRQESKDHKGWVLNNGRWLNGSHSAIKGCFVPAFHSFIRRADPELTRQQRLEAEDILLRHVLLPPEERSNELFGGDITIL
jgi:hypothetical protein